MTDKQTQSYLGFPRLQFSGKFQANPSTLNNTPDNYNPEIDSPEVISLFWNPNGNGGFNLKDCVVTRVVYEDGNAATSAEQDPIIGQPVAVADSGPIPRLVDLDPMQQNVSEIWGLSLQIGGATSGLVKGDYIEAAYNGIWPQSNNLLVSRKFSRYGGKCFAP